MTVLPYSDNKRLMRHFGMARQNMRFLRKIYFARQIFLEFAYFINFFLQIQAQKPTSSLIRVA
tara:strand:- start:51 stop:239 length:189 start_codon:yes stop_codon:yes gene_type:complete